jgi:hypothetical protein
MAKLYQAMLITYVLADNKKEAKIIASENEDDWTRWMVHDIKSVDSLPQKWTDSIPWGEDRNRTCSQILESE